MMCNGVEKSENGAATPAQPRTSNDIVYGCGEARDLTTHRLSRSTVRASFALKGLVLSLRMFIQGPRRATNPAADARASSRFPIALIKRDGSFRASSFPRSSMPSRCWHRRRTLTQPWKIRKCDFHFE